MQELQYPFDSRYIIKKKKSIKRLLLEQGSSFIDKKIAVLGGSTTHDIIMILELFLLDQGIRPEFYECEYAQYWEDVMFDNPELVEFGPDIIYIHTSNRNIRQYPVLSMSEAEIDELLDAMQNIVNSSNRMINVCLPYNEGTLLNRIHKEAEVISENYEEDGIYVQANGPEALADYILSLIHCS